MRVNVSAVAVGSVVVLAGVGAFALLLGRNKKAVAPLDTPRGFSLRAGKSYRVSLQLRSSLKSAANAVLTTAFAKGDSKHLMQQVSVTGSGPSRDVHFTLAQLPPLGAGKTSQNPNDFLKQSGLPAAGTVQAFSEA